MLEEIGKVLINNGPMGVIAGVLLWLLHDERKEHKATRAGLDAALSSSQELLQKTIETMTRVATLVSERLPNKNQGG